MSGAALGLNCDSENSGRKSVFSRPSTGGGARATRNVSTTYPFNFGKGFGLAIVTDFDHAG
jgi:hypothetical protein